MSLERTASDTWTDLGLGAGPPRTRAAQASGGIALRDLVHGLGRARRLAFPVLVATVDGPHRLDALVYSLGDLPGRRVPRFLLAKDEATRLVIGRTSDCEVVVADMNVSRRHASIVRTTAGKILVLDEGSRNGTFLDGERLKPGVPVEVRGGVGLLKLGPSARVLFMNESILGEYVQALRNETDAPGPRPSLAPEAIRRTWLGAATQDERTREILKAVRGIPFVAGCYEVTTEGALVEELATWPELVTFVEANAARILRVDAFGGEGRGVTVYDRRTAA